MAFGRTLKKDQHNPKNKKKRKEKNHTLKKKDSSSLHDHALHIKKRTFGGGSDI